jgi:23S rRNA (guanosine2251-2'-O)-methyltransferase
MGDTRVVLSRKLTGEPGQDLLETSCREPVKGRIKSEQDNKISAVLLDNIRSAWNAGSILRSADGFGFTHAYFCGITPTPDNEAVTKTSLGAEDSVTWSHHRDAVRLVKGLKRDGWKIFALEDDPRAVQILPFPDSQSTSPAILIVGNEITGVDPGLLDLCDTVFYIPMRGEKKSFNAAIAFSIAAHVLNNPHL